MTGWIYVKDDPMSHYRATEKPEQNEWPPKYHKFVMKLRDSNNEIAFCDSRRLARIRLIEHDGYDLRNVSPLKENGPDPVQESITLGWFQTQLKARKVPIKSWLLDQARIAGIGNWVGCVPSIWLMLTIFG
jgi:formamidopyrimidine-DNA glycosylase